MITEKIEQISVFFPCYNEQDNISKLVEDALKVLDAVAEDYQIIIVNDGSADKTEEIAKELAGKYDRVELASHEVNRGYGAALRTGFNKANKELVFYTDSDNQFDIGELPKLIELRNKYDIVSGYRIKRQDPWIRKVNAAIFNIALFVLFGLRVRDVDCAFKLYKRELFDKIEIKSDGALVDAEILIKAKKLGYKIGIISGGFNFFGKYLQKKLGIDYVFANVLEISDGKVTGKITGDIIDGPKKAEILKTIATVENISLEQTIAIGDGANDLAMISAAGLGVAFHAKPILKENAGKAISSVGLDGLLYLMGISEREIQQK